MSCKHEFIVDKTERVNVCDYCGLTQAEIQLAAANARIEELEQEINNYLSFGQGGASFTDSQWLDKLATAEQRAEQAEQNFEYAKDKIAMMGAEIVRLSDGKEQAEAQNKRMREALRRIINDPYTESYEAIAKAALEEK